MRYLKLVLLFVVCCGLPLWLAWELIGNRERASEPTASQSDELAALLVNSPGNYVSLEHNPSLNPGSGGDFALFAWVWFRKTPENEDDVVFLAKFDATEVHKQGYSLGVKRKDDKVRPIVYWRDVAGTGNTYEFAELRLLPRTWLLFVLSVRQEQFLSLHVVPAERIDGGDELLESTSGLGFLGAHDVSAQRLPQPTAQLIFGAGKNGLFRGKIGPLAVVKSAEGLTQDFLSKVTKKADAPGSLLEAVRGEVVFFSPDLEKDRSASKIAINRNTKKRRTRESAAVREEIRTLSGHPKDVSLREVKQRVRRG